MSETDHRIEPHVSPGELRAALTPRGETRRNPVLINEHAEQAEVEIQQLREALETATADGGELRTELATTKAESRERRNALEKLASAGFFKRRRVISDLAGRGVL